MFCWRSLIYVVTTRPRHPPDEPLSLFIFPERYFLNQTSSVPAVSVHFSSDDPFCLGGEKKAHIFHFVRREDICISKSMFIFTQFQETRDETRQDRKNPAECGRDLDCKRIILLSAVEVRGRLSY